jgi:hypothetical protein
MCALTIKIFSDRLRRYINECYYCGNRFDRLTREHLVPKHFKTCKWYPLNDNIVYVCYECNQEHSALLSSMLNGNLDSRRTQYTIQKIKAKTGDWYDPVALYKLYLKAKPVKRIKRYTY